MRLRNFLIPVIPGLLIVAIAATGRWWLPPLLEFAGSNKDAIDSLTKLLQALLALLGIVLAVVGLNRRQVGRVSTVTTVTTVTTQDGLPDETTKYEPAPIPAPPVPYFAHRYPSQ